MVCDVMMWCGVLMWWDVVTFGGVVGGQLNHGGLVCSRDGTSVWQVHRRPSSSFPTVQTRVVSCGTTDDEDTPGEVTATFTDDVCVSRSAFDAHVAANHGGCVLVLSWS